MKNVSTSSLKRQKSANHSLDQDTKQKKKINSREFAQDEELYPQTSRTGAKRGPRIQTKVVSNAHMI